MKQMSPRIILITLSLLVVCAAGCTSPTPSTPSTPSTPPTTAAASSNNLSPAQTTATAELAGSYDVSGTNEDGSAYNGALEIIKHGDAYQFHWKAGKEYDGVGVDNGVIAVAFTEGSDGKGCGVVTYKVLSDGALDGKWGYWGVNQVGTEKARHTSGSGLAGDYEVTGSNPDGKEYKGTLAVTAHPGGYQFSWSNGSEGFGIKQGDAVSVGIGGPRCAFVAYQIKPNGVLDGIWGGHGSDKTGTEKATKKK
jgi:hypothetical protein